MARQVAILHGWSDESESFRPLAKFLRQQGYKTVPIFLGDYISLRDDVKIDDVAKRMEEVVSEKMQRPAGARDRLANSFDLIVHSTGGLVARRWIAGYYANRPCPVKNLVMLAPANFGSRLAHIGRSMLGRVAKGWRTGFESGEEMLYALELASTFQWQLAESDLLIEPGGSAGSAVFYAADKVRPFVIVGTHPYDGWAEKLTNENGSDGTVRVAAANMNAKGITIDFSGAPENLLDPVKTPWQRRGGEDDDFPFAVLPDRDHGNIVRPDKEGYCKRDEVSKRLGQIILQALGVNTPGQYAQVGEAWNGISAETRTLAGSSDEAQKARDRFFRSRGKPDEFFHEYFQVNVRLEDEFGEPIPDYFLTFVEKQKEDVYSLKKNIGKYGSFFHSEVLESVHNYRGDNSRRSLFIDRYDLMRKEGFYDQLEQAGKDKELYVTVSAADPGDRIAYFTREANLKRGLIEIHQQSSPQKRWLQRHRTHLVKIIVPRAASPDIFTLKRG